MKKFKELFKEWYYLEKTNCSTLRSYIMCKSVALYIYEEMKEQYENVDNLKDRLAERDKRIVVLEKLVLEYITKYREGRNSPSRE